MPVTSADVGSSCLRCLEALVFVDFYIGAILLQLERKHTNKVSCTHYTFSIFFIHVSMYQYVQYGINSNSLLPAKLYLQVERPRKL